MSFKAPIIWKNGTILHAEQLNYSFKELYENLVQYSAFSNFYMYGFIDLSIDQKVLSNGILRIEKISCVTPNGIIFISDDYIEYDLMKISEDLSVAQKFFLSIEYAEETSEEICDETGEIISIVRKNIQAKIYNKEAKNSLPFCEVFVSRGAFVLSDFEGPYVKIKKENTLFKKISNLLIILQKKCLDLRNENAAKNQIENWLLLQSCLNAMGKILILINSNFNSHDLYKSLIEILLALSIHSNKIPYIEPYDHSISFVLNKSLLDSCYENILLNPQEDMIYLKQEGSFLCGEIGIVEKLILVLEPDEMEIRNWIMNTPIFSESHKLEVLQNRIKGIDRQFLNTNMNCILLELKLDRYFSFNEKIYIYNAGDEKKCEKIFLSYQ